MKKLLLALILAMISWCMSAWELDLADSLMEHGEYYRAITEYYHFVFSEDSDLARAGHRGIREAYTRGQDWEGLTDYLSYQRSTDDYAYLAWAWINRERPDIAAIVSADGQAVAKRQMYAISKSFEGDYTEADKVLRDIGDSGGLLNTKLLQITAGAEALPRKSPVIAGTLGIIPGLGYAYNGYWDTALASFTFNLLWIASALELMDQDLHFTAAGVASVGLGFYMGNIFGAAKQAKKINSNRRWAYLQKHLGPIIGEEFLRAGD